MTPQNPPPNQSTGLWIRFNCISSRFTEPYRAKSCFIPIAPTKGGITNGTRRIPCINLFPGNSYLTIK